VSAQQSSVPDGTAAPGRRGDGSLRRLRWLFWGVALVVGILAGVLIGVLRGTSGGPAAVPTTIAPAGPDASWAAGARPAPDFALTDQAGMPISLSRFRGRPVILTFIDPLCRNLCPTEAKILERAEASFPAARRPAIVAVSVNQWGNARRNLLVDMTKWKLTSDWHWAVGSAAKLRAVWAAYQIAVQDSPKTVAGVTVHNISHTEGAFLIDPRGDQRALYLYPFRAPDVARTVRQLARAQG
jgi:cytochrome oxidase Cu insertion factor (SCO1/SenC/PrrC family)